MKEEVRSKPRTCGEGRMKEEVRLLPTLKDVKEGGRIFEGGRRKVGAGKMGAGVQRGVQIAPFKSVHVLRFLISREIGFEGF